MPQTCSFPIFTDEDGWLPPAHTHPPCSKLRKGAGFKRLFGNRSAQGMRESLAGCKFAGKPGSRKVETGHGGFCFASLILKNSPNN